jgi:radical SAM superfamily enzyme YgiQ (UPF0313 family)
LTADILLVTLNSTYQHCSFGLRYLYANMGELQPRSRVVEYTINQPARDIAEKILAQNPQILGLGVYIWNARPSLELVQTLKALAPDLKIILGGPEVTHEPEKQEICGLADLVIRGEGDLIFADVCREILASPQEKEVATPPSSRWRQAPLPDIKSILSPYKFYTDEDIRNRIIYVEASRGCAFKCEYCLSALDKLVRSFDLESFLVDMDALIRRGARQFKFVDRTFNLGLPFSTRILKFFLERMDVGLFLHFEMVPDRLPRELRELIRLFPAGSLQFEVGIQTWDPTVAQTVSRRQDYIKIAENLRFLHTETRVHVHADLIAGLPGETPQSFAEGFDALAALGPHEIQLGLLKRLWGAPIRRHTEKFGLVYQDLAPYQILKTSTMSFSFLQRVGRMAKFWDLVANSGRFPRFMEKLRAWIAEAPDERSLFWWFLGLADFLATRHNILQGVPLMHLTESLHLYLTENGMEEKMWPAATVRELLRSDYTHDKKRDLPSFLRDTKVNSAKEQLARDGAKPSAIPDRQRRHQSTDHAVSGLPTAGTFL